MNHAKIIDVPALSSSPNPIPSAILMWVTGSFTKSVLIPHLVTKGHNSENSPPVDGVDFRHFLLFFRALVDRHLLSKERHHRDI